MSEQEWKESKANYKIECLIAENKQLRQTLNEVMAATEDARRQLRECVNESHYWRLKAINARAPLVGEWFNWKQEV